MKRVEKLSKWKDLSPPHHLLRLEPIFVVVLQSLIGREIVLFLPLQGGGRKGTGIYRSGITLSS